MVRLLKKVIYKMFYILISPFFLILVLLLPKRNHEMIWGPIPIINNKYWSNALKKAGYQSKTLMLGFYSINKKEDYDLYFEDLVPKILFFKSLKKLLAPLVAFLYIVRNAKVVHFPISGGPLGLTSIWRLEAFLLRYSKIKTVLIPYGADAFMYSRVISPTVRNGLLKSYPEAAKCEKKISKHVEYWTCNADIMLTNGTQIDGIGRWDCPVQSVIVIDVDEWVPKNSYSYFNGYNGPVRVIHTPNHRGFKGTEFIIDSINKLKREGLNVELILIEKMPNEKVRELMLNADILVEQLFIGYALSAIEGMASGLPVISNLENEEYTRVFRRFSFLNECPILSASPETITDILRILVTNPDLRIQLGQAGRKYVEKYHSYETAQFLFGSIYDKILYGKDVDLMNLFHPLKSEYNKRKPVIQHPLIENKLPKEYFDKCSNN